MVLFTGHQHFERDAAIYRGERTINWNINMNEVKKKSPAKTRSFSSISIHSPEKKMLRTMYKSNEWTVNALNNLLHEINETLEK